MTHRKHAAALLTAVLLLALTACGRQTAAASDPAQTPAAPAVETPVIAAPAGPTPAAGYRWNGSCSVTPFDSCGRSRGTSDCAAAGA